MKYSISTYAKKTFRLMGGLCLLATILLLHNCKEPSFDIDDPHSYIQVFMQSASDGAINKSFAIKDEWISNSFGAGYGGPQQFDQPIKVTFMVDEKALETYNQQNNTNYELPPTDSYRLNEKTVEIATGRSGSEMLSLEINPLKLNGTRAYLLPISIQSVSPTFPIAEGMETTYYIINGEYDENPYSPIAIDEWTIHDFSSDDQDAVGGLAPYCIDGDISTCWLSQWRRFPDGTRPVHPHYVAVDMNNQQTLHGIQLFGRQTAPGQSSQTYLFPVNVHVETSNDGENWETAGLFTLVASSSNEPEDTMYFEDAVTCRYFKVTVLNSTSANGDTTAIAELVAF